MKTKIKNCIILTLALLIFTSCEKMGINQRVELPEEVSFDLNNDGEDDLELHVTGSIGCGIDYTFYTHFLKLFPVRDLQFLVTEADEYPVPVESDQTISKNPDGSGIKWSAVNRFGYFLGSINEEDKDGKITKDKYWSLSDNADGDSIYVPFKIDDQIGWAKFSVNRKSGKVKLRDSRMTSSDSITIP